MRFEAIAVHVGQCGNAIAGQVWSEQQGGLGKGFEREREEDGSTVPRAIQVDAEPKAVTNARRTAQRLNQCRRVTGQSGRGGMAAQGMVENRDGVLRESMDALRLEAEACDRIPDVVFTVGISGGTGAGLGARMVEEARLLLPEAPILVAAAMPREGCEAPMAPLNRVLTVPAMLHAADGMLMLPNGVLARERAPDQARRLGSSLASSLAPCRGSPLAACAPVRDIIAGVCPDPVARTVSVEPSPGKKPAWNGALAAMARGTCQESAASMASRLGKRCCIPPLERWFCTSRKLEECALSVVPKSGERLLRSDAEKALCMASAGAYVHWHERIGVDASALRDSAHAAFDFADALAARSRDLGR